MRYFNWISRLILFIIMMLLMWNEIIMYVLSFIRSWKLIIFYNYMNTINLNSIIIISLVCLAVFILYIKLFDGTIIDSLKVTIGLIIFGIVPILYMVDTKIIINFVLELIIISLLIALMVTKSSKEN